MSLKEKIVILTKNKNVRNGSLFSVFSFFNSGVSFIIIILIAKYLDPEGYGRVNLFNTYVTLFGYFICLNSTGIIAVNFFRKKIEELRATINSVVIITIVSYFALAFICFNFTRQLEKYFGFGLLFQIIALTICFFNVFTSINLNLWRIEEKVVSYGVYSCLKTVTYAAFTMLLVIGYKMDWLGQIYANLTSSLIFFIISLYVLFKRLYLTFKIPSKCTFSECFKYGVPLIPHSMSFWLRNGLDRLLVNGTWGASLVGLFSFSSNFACIIQIIGDAFNATNSVDIYQNLANSDNNTKLRLRKQTIIMISIYLLATICVILSMSIAIPFFFPKYDGCLQFLVVQCFTAFFSCVYLQFVNYIMFFKKTKVLMYITSSASIFHMLLSWFLTPISIYYTLYIGLVSQMLITLGVFLYSRKIYKVF